MTTLDVIGGVLAGSLLLATAAGFLSSLGEKLIGTWRGRILLFALLVMLIDIAFRKLAPKSAAFRYWTKGIETLGKFWTAVILSIIYFVSVSIVSVFMKLFAKDPLDRTLAPEPSFWRAHEPNPLGPHAAARHQF